MFAKATTITVKPPQSTLFILYTSQQSDLSLCLLFTAKAAALRCWSRCLLERKSVSLAAERAASEHGKNRKSDPFLALYLARSLLDTIIFSMRLLNFGRLRSKSEDRDQSNSNGTSRSNRRREKSSADDTAVFRVTVPEGIESGNEFQVYAGGRIVRVRCPEGVTAGQSLQITVPKDPKNSDPQQQQQQQQQAGANSQEHNTGNNNNNNNSNNDSNNSRIPPDSPNVSRIEGESNSYNVTIPDNIRGGQQFPVSIQGQQLMVTCPVNARPGMKVRVNPPPPPPPTLSSTTTTSLSSTSPTNGLERQTSTDRPLRSRRGGGGDSNNTSSNSDDTTATQLFEVQGPEGVQPGHPFALLAGGVRVLVTCPLNAGPGLRIRFNLPKALMMMHHQRKTPQNEAALIKLSYDKDGWARTIRVSDMRFQWVRMDGK